MRTSLRSLPREISPRIEKLVLLAVIGLAAVLRFTGLDARGFWRDEAVTVGLVRRGLGDMLSTIPDSEGTPPLYYVLAWGWTRIFGSDEVGLRSFSALVGTIAVVVVYATGARLFSLRVGLAAALLAAVSPFLVWHSQDGRAYALFTLLGAASFLAFLLALDHPGRWELGLWAVASALALSTHYFAVFLVAAEAGWLLAVARPRRRAIAATLAVTLVGLSLLPLALAQRSSASVAWIAEIPRSNRMKELVEQFLVGPQAPAPLALAAFAGAGVLVGLVLLRIRGDVRERRGALLVGATALTTLALAFLLSLSGVDYFLARNLIVIWIPLCVALAAGLAGRRSGFVGMGALSGLAIMGAAVVVFTAGSPKFDSEDWRGAARALGAPSGQRAVVLWLGVGQDPFVLYRPNAGPLPPGGALVREVDVVSVGDDHADIDGRRRSLLPPRPFRQVDRIDRRHFTIVRFSAPRPQLVRRATLVSGGPGHSAAVLLDR